MVSEWIEVGIVFDPGFILVTGVRNKVLQQVKCCLSFPEPCINAGCVVLGKSVVRINGQGSGQPFLGAVSFTKSDERAGAEVGRAWIFRMHVELLFRTLDAFSGSIFSLGVAAQ